MKSPTHLILSSDERAILLGLLEDMSQEEDIEQQPIDIQSTIVSVIRKLGGTYYGRLKKWIADNSQA